MPLGNQPTQAILGDMGIDLGGGDVGVPKHLLHAAQVGAAVDQVRGEGVPEDMGREPPRIDAGRHGDLLQRLGKALAREVA